MFSLSILGGKSAIASALILALGARGSGLASFIRIGQTRAKITVTICNYLNASNKSESYHPEIFGPKITIKRVIYRTGFSSYEVRSSADKVISRKKVEVDNIVKFFQIDVNNPINILTQQVSKNFLNSNDPKDKFKFFVKATQLKEMKNDHEYAFENKSKLLKLFTTMICDYMIWSEKVSWALERKLKKFDLIIEQSRVELSTASQNWDNAKKVLANKTAEMKARQYEINCFNKNISDLQKRIQGIETQLE